jgi:hypothetical protein
VQSTPSACSPTHLQALQRVASVWSAVPGSGLPALLATGAPAVKGPADLYRLHGTTGLAAAGVWVAAEREVTPETSGGSRASTVQADGASPVSLGDDLMLFGRWQEGKIPCRNNQHTHNRYMSALTAVWHTGS